MKKLLFLLLISSNAVAQVNTAHVKIIEKHFYLKNVDENKNLEEITKGTYPVIQTPDKGLNDTLYMYTDGLYSEIAHLHPGNDKRDSVVTNEKIFRDLSTYSNWSFKTTYISKNIISITMCDSTHPNFSSGPTGKGTTATYISPYSFNLINRSMLFAKDLLNEQGLYALKNKILIIGKELQLKGMDIQFLNQLENELTPAWLPGENVAICKDRIIIYQQYTHSNGLDYYPFYFSFKDDAKYFIPSQLKLIQE